MEEDFGFSGFNCEMFVLARPAGLNILETAAFLFFGFAAISPLLLTITSEIGCVDNCTKKGQMFTHFCSSTQTKGLEMHSDSRTNSI